MKRLVSTITALILTIVMCTNIVTAEEMQKSKDNEPSFAPFIKEATCKVEKISSGQDVIILSRTKQLSSSDGIKKLRERNHLCCFGITSTNHAGVR